MTCVSLDFSRTVGKVKWLLGVQAPENNDHILSFILFIIKSGSHFTSSFSPVFFFFYHFFLSFVL